MTAHSSSLIPLEDWHLLQSTRGSHVALWAIRNNGPLTLSQLHRLICLGEQAPGTDTVEQLRSLADTVKRLNHGGLVEISSGSLDDLVQALNSAASADAAVQAGETLTLQVSAAVGLIQRLFDLSLKAYAAGQGDKLRAEPIFGAPTAGDWPEIFVIMPFLETLHPVHTQAIMPAAEALNISCKRGDDFFTDGSIINEVWDAIFYSKLCVCDCTGRNANVFYEAGIAHTLGRPCVIVAQSPDDVPFHNTHHHIILYDLTPDGLRKLRGDLTRAIGEELAVKDETIKHALEQLG